MSRIETARTLGHSLVGALGKDERRERDLALDGLEAREGRPARLRLLRERVTGDGLDRERGKRLREGSG